MLKPAVKARNPATFRGGVPAFAIADAAGFGPGFVFVPALPALFWRDSGELLRPKKAVARWTEPETQVGRVVNSQVAAPEPGPAPRLSWEWVFAARGLAPLPLRLARAGSGVA